MGIDMAKRKRRRIRDIFVDEISFVDRPANRKPFLFWKRAEGIEDVGGAGDVSLDKKALNLEVGFSTEGTPDSTQIVVNGTKLDHPESFALYYNPIGDETISLVCDYSVRAKGETKGGFTSTRHYRLTKNIQIEDEDNEDNEDNEDDKDGGGDEIDKAVWSTKYVNDLPDSAFLYVEPGGKKDKDGKTVPRSLRHFPYKDANGKVDLPHLRNAIARIPQANIPDAKKKSLQAKARRLLASAKAAKTTKGVKKADDDDIKTLTDFVGRVDELDGDLARAMAEKVKVVKLYLDDCPGVLLDVIKDIVKLAVSVEAEDITEVDKVDEIDIDTDELAGKIADRLDLDAKIKDGVKAVLAERDEAARKLEEERAAEQKAKEEQAAAAAAAAANQNADDEDEEVPDDVVAAELAAATEEALSEGPGE